MSRWRVETPLEAFDRSYTPEPNTGCWLWLEHVKNGYGFMQKKDCWDYAHRVSWRLHKGPIPPDMFVLHKCDMPPCVNPDHLFLGTQPDNIADMNRKGRHGYTGSLGEVHPAAKLTDVDVLAIRASTATIYAEADRYDVHPSTISDIRRRKTWRHL